MVHHFVRVLPMASFHHSFEQGQRITGAVVRPSDFTPLELAQNVLKLVIILRTRLLPLFDNLVRCHRRCMVSYGN